MGTRFLLGWAAALACVLWVAELQVLAEERPLTVSAEEDRVRQEVQADPSMDLTDTRSQSVVTVISRLDLEVGRLENDLRELDRELRSLETRLSLRETTLDLSLENGLFEEHVGGIPHASNLRPTRMADEGEGNQGGTGSVPVRLADDIGTLPGWLDDGALTGLGGATNRLGTAVIPYWEGLTDSCDQPGGCQAPSSGNDGPNREFPAEDEGEYTSGAISNDLEPDSGIPFPHGGAVVDGNDPSDDDLVGGAMEIVSPDVLSLPSTVPPSDSSNREDSTTGSTTRQARGTGNGTESIQERIRRLREQRRQARRDLEALNQQRADLIKQLAPPDTP